jgi:hypothetical protein
MKNLTYLLLIAFAGIMITAFFGFKSSAKTDPTPALNTKTFKIKKIRKVKGTYYFTFDGVGQVEVSGAIGSNTITGLYGIYYESQIYTGTASGTYSLSAGTLSVSYTSTIAGFSWPETYNGGYLGQDSEPIAFPF